MKQTQTIAICILALSLLLPTQGSYAGGNAGGSFAASPANSSSTTSQSNSVVDSPFILGTGLPTNGSIANCLSPTGDPKCAGTGNPINVMTGNKYQVDTDMAALPGIMGIEIVRHYNSLHMGLGQMGYGWRLSYETNLYAVNNTLQIVQADGSRLIFNRDPNNPNACACQNPAQGHVMIYVGAKGKEYTWFQRNGKQLHFNYQGKLERISVATGESLYLTRGPQGELLKVTDPQGRSLILHYADKRNKGFKGIIAIDSPVGRYTYQHNNDPKSAGYSNLILVRKPAGNNSKHNNQQEQPIASNATTGQHALKQTSLKQQHLEQHYHYGEADYIDANMAKSSKQPAIPEAGHLLTGISHIWQEPDTKDSTKTLTKTERYRTWAYDQLGRGILSVHGYPKQLDSNGKLQPNTGIKQVNIRYQLPQPNKLQKQTANQSNGSHQYNMQYPRITRHGEIGKTIITNSLGQETTYAYTVIAGEYRLISVIGAGCHECSEPNLIYGHDKVGRLTHITKVKVQAQAGKRDLIPLHTQQTDYDHAGRVQRVFNIAYRHGKPQTPQLLVRYEYPNTPVLPKQNAINAVHEAHQVENQPSLIAKLSVIKGKEHQWQISYNNHGQPLTITETGYRPALPTDNGKQPISITRTFTYQYQTINGRSLLASMDGPLPNGQSNSPQDSDITQYGYDEQGSFLNRITAPNNITTRLEYDVVGTSAVTGGTGRVIKSIANSLISTNYTYNPIGKVTSTHRYPASLNVSTAQVQGLLQSTAMAYDDFGNNTMIKRADGQAIHLQYGFDGKLVAMRDGLGNRVEWKDWAKGSFKKGGTVTTQQWFTADAPDTVVRAWYFWRDNQNRLTQRISPDGGVDTWRYADHKTSDTEQTLQVEAANDSNWVQHIDPLNRMTLNAVSSLGSVKARATPTGYLDANFILNADTVNTSATGSQSNQQSIYQPVQVLDDFGRAILFSSPQHGTHIAQYNDANRITNIQQADGTRIKYTYDVAGRLLTKTAQALKSKTNDSVTYSYNAFGLRQVKDSTQTLTYTQDLLGREIGKVTTLTLKNGNTKTYRINTRYTDNGKVKVKQLINGDWLVFGLDEQTGLTKAMTIHSTIWPSLTNTLANWLDIPDLPLQIATKKTVVSDIKAHPFNGITHLTHGNGFSDHFDFDLAGRLLTVSHSKHSQNSKTNSPFIKASYTYDAGRRLTSELISTGNFPGKVKEYAYTGWNDFSTPPKSGFIQAVVSNHSKNNKVSAKTISTSIESKAWAPIKLDQAGRTTADTNYRYHYNVWGKLTSVQTKTNNKTIATYQNNALGERVMASYPSSENGNSLSRGKGAGVRKNPPTQTRYYLYDKQQRIAELDENGHVIQQYLYINQMPVAVINTPTQQNQASDNQNPAGIIALHTDRRHAPIAATDEDGKIIWQAEYDAWGRVISPSPLKGAGGGGGKSSHSNVRLNDTQNTFDLALRLPGQWQDQATGLHYNYQRDYSPDTGRYLTPDPLGFPDGLDSYAYVNNDPLNKLDPLGLYQSDIHYYMTFFLAVVAGVPAEDARIIALAAQYVDENPATRPVNPTNTATTIWSATWNQQMLIKYHFTISDPETGNTIKEYENSLLNTVVKNPSEQLMNLLAASVKAECKNAKLQFFGEYLHAFEDTYSHRDKTNKPYDALGWFNLGVGHGLDESEPDYTFDNDTNGWDVRAQRTLEMELEVFNKFNLSSFKTGKEIDLNILKATLEEFNSIKESEENETEENPLFKEKLKLLNKTLADWGVKNTDGSAIDFFNQNNFEKLKSVAESNRDQFLCDAQGNRLKQSDYPGIILPSKPCQKS